MVSEANLESSNIYQVWSRFGNSCEVGSYHHVLEGSACAEENTKSGHDMVCFFQYCFFHCRKEAKRKL